MAVQTVAVSANTIEDTPIKNGIVSLADSALASLLSNTILNYWFQAKDLQRTGGQEYSLIVAYDDASGTAISNPFKLKVTTGATAEGAQSAMQAFIDANGSYFFSFPVLQYRTQENLTERYVVALIYNESSADGVANFPAPTNDPTGGGSSSGEIIGLTNGVPVTVDSVVVDNVQGVKWYLQLFNPTTGVREAWEIPAHHDGTDAADATAADYTISGLGPDSGTGHTIVVDLNGAGASQVMRLRVTAGAAGWSAFITKVVSVRDS